jgi:hypothetical protein
VTDFFMFVVMITAVFLCGMFYGDKFGKPRG